MKAFSFEPMQPDAEEIAASHEALRQVRSLRARKSHMVQLLAADGTAAPVALPRAAVELLERILAYMASGQAVAVVPSHAELTTQQAAEMLNVSRPFLIGLLEAGEVAYRKVGKHRRVRADSLLAYIRVDDQRRREAADELSGLTQQMGLA